MPLWSYTIPHKEKKYFHPQKFKFKYLYFIYVIHSSAYPLTTCTIAIFYSFAYRVSLCLHFMYVPHSSAHPLTTCTLAIIYSSVSHVSLCIHFMYVPPLLCIPSSSPASQPAPRHSLLQFDFLAKILAERKIFFFHSPPDCTISM